MLFPEFARIRKPTLPFASLFNEGFLPTTLFLRGIYVPNTPSNKIIFSSLEKAFIWINKNPGKILQAEKGEINVSVLPPFVVSNYRTLASRLIGLRSNKIKDPTPAVFSIGTKDWEKDILTLIKKKRFQSRMENKGGILSMGKPEMDYLKIIDHLSRISEKKKFQMAVDILTANLFFSYWTGVLKKLS